MYNLSNSLEERCWRSGSSSDELSEVELELELESERELELELVSGSSSGGALP
jgi:hypothetical protein